MDCTKRRREEYAIAIRREKKQQIFKAYRNKLRVNMIEQQQHRMLQILDSPQRKQEWVLSKARQLAGIPDQSWRHILNDLFASLLCFKGKGSFQIWISTDIIKNICLLFEQDYRELNLASDAAKLLVVGNIIYIEEEEQQEKTSQIAKEIFCQQILRNLILYSQDTTLPHQQVSHFMTLIANLAIYEPGHVIKNGGFTTFAEWALRILKQRKINRAYLDQIYCFFYFFADNLKKVPTNLNTAIKLLSLLNEFSQIDQTVPLLKNMLDIVLKITQPPAKNALFANVFQLKPLTSKIFQLATHQNQNIREVAWKILGNVSSGQFNNMMQTFQEHNYINTTIMAYQLQAKDSRNFDKITSNILSCINNLVCESDVIRQTIICSPIINIIIDSAHPDRSTNVRKDAYYCMCSVLSTENYNLLNKIVHEMPILQKLVLGLQAMLDKDKNTIKDTIITLYKLIKLDQVVYTNNGNGILETLEAKYCFSNVLNLVIAKYYKDATISQTVNFIFDLYSC